ncbi:60s ribosomal protein l29-1 [Quercus suber]|uniref:60S ribosomal protein L29 n=1 Tax=Quercus suber TaxID=58331 RepID=A0AAW0IZ53_QUESU
MANKNHTSHNQSYKVHENGIKKPNKHRHTSTKEMIQESVVGCTGRMVLPFESLTISFKDVQCFVDTPLKTVTCVMSTIYITKTI